MKSFLTLLILTFSFYNTNSQILSDTIRGVNCNQDGFIHTTINDLVSYGGQSFTQWYYLDTLNNNWDIINQSSAYITSGDMYLNNLTTLSSDSLTTKLGGTYKIKIIDSSGDSIVETWYIRFPLGMKLCCHQNVNCRGDSSGSFRAVGYSGSPPYLYSFYDSVNTLINVGTDSIFDNLSAGKYKVVVKDQDNCLKERDNIVIFEPPNNIFVNLDVNHVDCIGNENGILEISCSGGKPYSYGYNLILTSLNSDTVAYINSFNTSSNILSFSSDSLNISNLTSGNYKLTILDSNLCFYDTTFTLTEPGPYSPIVTQSNEPICSDDSVTITIDSILGAVNKLYSYWLLSSNDSLYCSPGTYNLVAIDSINNCLDTFEYLLSPKTEIEFQHSVKKIICHGDSTGEIMIDTVFGGTSPYQFTALSTHSTNNNLFVGNSLKNLKSGNYSITIIDSNNCKINRNIQVNQSDKILSNAVFYPPSCKGYSDGRLLVNITGGVKPYFINWSNGTGNIDSLYGLEAGTYFLSVSDSEGCNIQEQLFLNEPDSLSLKFDNFSNPLNCRGELTTIDALPSGGTPPYTFSWHNFDSSFQLVTGAGIKSCTVQDKNGCKISSLIEITEPSPFTIGEYNIIEPTCNKGADISISLTGGTRPYNILWSSSDSSSSVNNIQSNNAWVIVSDFCKSTDSMYFSFDQYSLETSLYYDNVTHYSNIEIDFTTSTGPFVYTWKDINSNIVSSTSQAGPLCEATYFVTVTDISNNCTIVDTLNADFYLPNGLIDFSTTTVFADSDLWDFGPYTYLWDDGSIGQHADLCSGNHWVEVTDVNGCTVREDFVIEEISLTLSPFDLLIECDISNEDLELEVNAEGGIPPYQILWSDGSKSNPINIGLSPGLQSVTVTDFNNCSVDTSFRISALTSECIPNVFSPNNDQVNDTWIIEDSFLYSNSIIKVYNRYGKLVFDSKGYNEAWDGKNKDGSELSAGCYFYCIEVKEDAEPIKGTVTIVR